MRAMSTALRTALASVAAGVLMTGCSGGSGGSGAEGPSARQLLRDANATMRTLTSVTIDSDGTSAVRLRTDLKDRCANRTSFKGGGVLDQIRIGAVDYVRPDSACLKKSGHTPGGSYGRGHWVRTRAADAVPGDGLAACTWPFAEFGTASGTKEPVTVGGVRATPVTVTDPKDKDGTYTVSIAAQGKPYLLKVAYEGGGRRTTTSFSGFGAPLDVRAPAASDIVDTSGA
ncbi:hypothetical protein ABZ858_00730 [Streptomyces sp. NPDC047017]|uniref:hypothetical protein n=1 Tax=Streptomyces sp. NPDC047017 TaxID=3155024 RepID=UPI0033D301A7